MSDLRKSVLNSQQHSRWTESSQSSRASTSHSFGSRSSGASIRYISVPRIPSSGQSSKIERKLREFLLNFKSGGISINDGVEQILKYVNKYGTNSNHEHERVDKLSGASSSTFHTQRQQPPKAKPKPKPKTMTSKTVHHQSKSKQLALEKELARLADSDGFVSTPPRRLKRKPKPVVLFDTVQYETKRKLRSSDRHRADVDTIQKTITKEVQHTNATRVVNVSPNIANNMENVTQSSRTSSSFVSEIGHNAEGSVQHTIKHTVTHQRTTTLSTNGANFKHKDRMIYHIPMILVKQEGDGSNAGIIWN